MTIEVVTRVTAAHIEAFARLLPQLSPSTSGPSLEHLRRVADAPGHTLLIARDGQGAIAGTLTLIIFLTPSAILGWIEDVVVDSAARGQGVGEALVREGVRLARDQGASQIDLHSGNHRPAAIRLYQRVGFRKFETNVWRLVQDGS